MRGGYSAKIEDLRTRLLNFASLIELELDFAEEDVEFADRGGLMRLLDEMEGEITRLTDSFTLGNAIKTGIQVVIAGRPNAGKSTLLNALLQEEKALVSDIPGTTRDVIEDVITIEGLKFRFMDTAGLRTTEDTLEQMGIDRTRQKISEAAIVLYLFDLTASTPAQVEEDLALLPEGKTVLIVGNKADAAGSEAAWQERYPRAQLFISARQEEGMDALRSLLIGSLNLPQYAQEETVVTNVRHLHALKQTQLALHNVRTGFSVGIPTDLITTDIRQALHALGSITGVITSDEILGNIFGKFCIGK
jgi:tRNA modification GTPase